MTAQAAELAANLITQAASGLCALHPARSAVAAITGSAFRPKGACEACAAHAEQHPRYTVHHRPPRDSS